MLNLRDALAKGVASAEEAGRNHTEIDGVLSDVSAEIASFTENTVKVIRAKIEGGLSIALETMQHDLSGNEYSTMDKLFLVRADDENQRAEFARLLRGKRGYPCSLLASGSSQTCLDRQSLLVAFSNVLAAHDTGNILHGLMHYDSSATGDY